MTRAGQPPPGVAKDTSRPIERQQSYLCDPPDAARPDDRRFWYCPVQCTVCGAVVQAAKFSAQHTSVQWDVAAVHQCAEFARRAAAGEQTPLIERCDAMRASIEVAVREGRLPVAPP